jgi:hypothetical protein
MTIVTECKVLLGDSGIERYTRELWKAMAQVEPTISIRALAVQRRVEQVRAVLSGHSSITVAGVFYQDLALGAIGEPLVRLAQHRLWRRAIQPTDTLAHHTSHFRWYDSQLPAIVTVHDLFPLYAETLIDRKDQRLFVKAMKNVVAKAHAGYHAK